MNKKDENINLNEIGEENPEDERKEENLDVNVNADKEDIKENIEIVKKKLEVFFPNAKKDDIKKIDEIIKDIKKKDLFYYKTIERKINYY